jgi:RNA recognition motif-containing protein
MSLFIGNIPRTFSIPDLVMIFSRYGQCTVDLKGNFAFIDYDHLKSAEHAIRDLQGKVIHGNALNIEWSKKTKKKSKLPEPSNTSRNISRSEIQCYYCREQGHISKDCKFRGENSSGHTQNIDSPGLVSHIRKLSSSCTRIRLKSPSRYSLVAGSSFNIVKLG